MSTPDHEQVPILSAAELKTLLNNVDLSALNFTGDFNSADLAIHDTETTEFILPITNGNGDSCVQFEEISDNEFNLSLSPLKTSDFCETTPKKRRHSCPSLLSYCNQSSLSSRNSLRRSKSSSNVNILTDDDVYIRRIYPRRSPIFNLSQFHHVVDRIESRTNVETIDVCGYKLPLVTVTSDNLERFVCVSDVFETFFSRRHWDEFKEILSKNGIQPVFGVVKNAYGAFDDVNAITVNQCQTLLLNNQARKDGFVKCIRISFDGNNAADGAQSTSATPCSLTPSMTPSAVGETKLILATERQVGELSSGIKTRHADQSDILYVEFDGKTLPSITVNDKQYVRLVDVQKNVLTPDIVGVLSKHVGELKKVCGDASVVVTKCRPNEKARLVVYANSFRSNSLHVIAAEDLPRLVGHYKKFENRRISSARKKYLKRSRTLDDDEDVDLDFSAFKRLRDDDSTNFNSARRFYSADSSEPSPLSRPSSVSTDTASCSGESVSASMPPNNNNIKKPLPSPQISSSTGNNSSFYHQWNSTLDDKSSKQQRSALGNDQRSTTKPFDRNHVATSYRKAPNSFEQMLASADDFYKTKPPPNNVKQKVSKNNNNNDDNSLVSRVVDRVFANALSSSTGTNFADKFNSKMKKKTSRDNNNSSRKRPQKFSAPFFSSSTFNNDDNNRTTTNSHSKKSSQSKLKSIGYNDFSSSSSKGHHHYSSQTPSSGRRDEQPLSPPSTPPPFISPEISYRVNPDVDFDLGRNETLMTEILVDTLARPCSVYIGKSSPLPVAVYNRHFQRGPAGYYYDYLFVYRSSECILCCMCKKFMSLRSFIQHVHGADQRLVDPLLFMFVRNPTMDRFDLWRNLCVKAKKFGVNKLINYNLPDDLAEYYEERRFVQRNNVIDEQNQKEARSTAAILLSLSRGK